MNGRNDIHHISAFRQKCKNVWKEGQDLDLVLIVIIPEYGGNCISQRMDSSLTLTENAGKLHNMYKDYIITEPIARDTVLV